MSRINKPITPLQKALYTAIELEHLVSIHQNDKNYIPTKEELDLLLKINLRIIQIYKRTDEVLKCLHERHELYKAGKFKPDMSKKDWDLR